MKLLLACPNYSMCVFDLSQGVPLVEVSVGAVNS